jgi:hypothetical protein
MRISIDRTDRAYDLAKAKKVAQVTLDGKKVAAVTADDEEGLVRYYLQDPQTGSLIQGGDGQPQVIEARGKVVIEMRKDDRAWSKDNVRETKVEVGRQQDGSVHVLVHSWARPGAIKRVKIEGDMPTGHALVQKVGIAAGHGAELLCEQFGDRLDPGECARAAMEQASMMIADERATRH